MAQEEFTRGLPGAEEGDGFRGRIAAALLHAEEIGQYGWGRSAHARLIREPLRSLPERWPVGVSALVRDTAHTAWGDEAASSPRAVFFRETVLIAARLRLARLDLAAASRILEQSEPGRDAALMWQLAAVWAVRARYVREHDLWPDVRELLREAASRRLLSPAAGRMSSRAVARGLADPDDLNLRLALTALSMGRRKRAADRLAEVSDEPAAVLRVPRLLLESEALRSDGRLEPATAALHDALELAPDCQVVVAALVAALEAAGRWDEAAALAGERLRARQSTHPWAQFLNTWAVVEEPALDWLRDLVRA